MALAAQNEETSGKRKADPTDENEEPAKKRKEFDPNFSELEFIVRLRDDESISNGLEDFASMSKAFSDGANCTDIVSKYLTRSPECSEILGLLDITQKKLSVGQLSSVYECLAQILKYIQSESKFRSTGDTILQRLMSAHLGQLYNCLRPQNKSRTIKNAMQLLIALVMVGDKSKKAVQSKFNFDHEMFQSLFQRRDRHDPEDVRSCLVLFTMSFIVEGDGELINAIVQQRGFIQMTVAGLMYDPKDMVLDVLATLIDKVVKNPDLTKTAKIRLFSEKVLKQVCDLYEWEGPKGWRPKKDKKQDSAAKDFLNDEGFIQDRSVVADVVHEFLLAMCCSQKFGIVFFDKMCGMGPRNLNQLLTHMLQSLSMGLDKPLKQNLAVNILKACPDQLFHFLPTWSNSLSLRWSEKWAQSMSFLVEVYQNLSAVPSFLTPADVMVKDVDSLVSIITVYYLPCHKIASTLTLGIRNEDLRVRHHCLLLIQVIVQNTVSFLSTISSGGFIPDRSAREVVHSVFSSLITKTMPSPPSLFGCMEKVLDILSSPKKLEAIGIEVDLVDHVAMILKTLKLYQSLWPELLSDKPKDVAKLVEAVGKLQVILDASLKDKESETATATATDSKAPLPQLDLLELLSGTNATTLSLAREGLLEKLLRSAHQCSKENHKEKTTSLVCKMLTSLDILSGHDQELQLWIDVALTYDSRNDAKDNSSTKKGSDKKPAVAFSPIGYLATCLCSLINNPMPYLDRVMEVVAEADMDMDSDDNDGDSSVSKDKNGLKEAEIKDILKMKEGDMDLTLSNASLQNMSYQKNILPFSPLSSVAMEKLHYCKGDKSAMAEFTSAVLIKILHTQANPAPFSALVNSYKEEALPAGITDYFDYWAGKGKKKHLKKAPTVDLKMSVSFSCDLLNWFMSVENSHQHPQSEDMVDIPRGEKLVCLKQAMFYLEHCLSPNFGLGLKMKRGKNLRKTMENIVDCYIEDMKKSEGAVSDTDEDKAMSVDGENEGMNKTTDSNEEIVDKVSEIILCILNNSTLKQVFLSGTSSLNENESPSKSEKSEKLEMSVSKMLCNILKKCKGLGLSQHCKEILQEYLEKALDGLLLKKAHDTTDTCLSFIKTSSCHLDFEALTKSVSSFLKLPKALFFSDEEEEEMSQSENGQPAQSFSPVGECFLQILMLWIQTLKSYRVVETKDNSILLTQRPKPKRLLEKPTGDDNASSHNQPKASSTPDIWLEISKMKPLFDFLPLCSNLDSTLCDAVNHFPQLSIGCSQKTLKTLVGQYLSLGNDRRTLVEKLVSSHDVFHRLAGNFLEKNINAVIKDRHFSLLKAYLDKTEEVEDRKTLEIIRQKVLAACEGVLSQEDKSLWSGLELLVIPAAKKADKAFHKDLFSAVKSYVTGHQSSARHHHFSLLNAICKSQQISSEGQGKGEEDQERGKVQRSDLLDIVLKQLVFLLLKKANRNPELEEKLIYLCLDTLKLGGTPSSKFISSSWAGFVKSSLKQLYTEQALLDLLSKLVTHVYESGEEGKTSTTVCGTMSLQMMFEMSVSHTAFLPTLLSASDVPAKHALVNLLYTLYTIDPSCVKKELVSPFMGAYTASLSLTDQRLLKMIQTFLQDMELDETFPVLWGKAYLDHKANTRALGPSLDAEIAMKIVLSEIDFGRMHKTILNFALKRNAKDFKVTDAKELESLPDCYDPCYFLRVFRQILSPAKIVPVRSFVSKECLSFLLISLTSHHLHTRLLAYHCLNEFYGHLENSGLPERNEYAFILDVLNASRIQHGQKLSYIVALFLTRAVKLMTDPSDHMYLPVLRFILLKPEMDLNGVPEFYNLFFAAGSQHTKERNWMLALLRDGIKEGSDYWLYQKRLVFRLLMSFYSSAMSDKASQLLVLEMVRNACHQRSSATDLIVEHGLTPWLAAVVNGLKDKPEHTGVVCSIVEALCSSLEVTDHVEAIDMKSVKDNPLMADIKNKTMTEKEKMNCFSFSDESSRLVLPEEKTEKKREDQLGIPKSVLLSLNRLIKSLNWFLSVGSNSNVVGSTINAASAEKKPMCV